MTIIEKEKYLLKVNYKAKDIMALLDCGHTWATRVMKECANKFGGAVKGRNVITAKSFWLHEGTTLEEELRLLSVALGYGKAIR